MRQLPSWTARSSGAWTHLKFSMAASLIPATWYSNIWGSIQNMLSSISHMVKELMKSFECDSWHNSTETSIYSFMLTIIQRWHSTHHVPVLGDSRMSTHLSLVKTLWLGSVILSIFQTRKPRQSLCNWHKVTQGTGRTGIQTRSGPRVQALNHHDLLPLNPEPPARWIFLHPAYQYVA